MLLNLPLTLLLALFFLAQLHTQSRISQDLLSIKSSITNLEIIASKEASASADTFTHTLDGLRTDIATLQALQSTDNLSGQLTGRIAGMSQDLSKMYPQGIQGYVALNTYQYSSAQIIKDRTKPDSAITTLTDDTPMPYAFKANGWYLVTINDQQGWIESIYLKDVTAEVVANHE